MSGMLCHGLIGVLHTGQCEAGRIIPGGGWLESPLCSRNSSQSLRHSCFILAGSRKMTTFRKLPTSSPRMPAIRRNSGSEITWYWFQCVRRLADNVAELEDRQVHRDNQGADNCAEKNDNDWLEKAVKRVNGIIDCLFVVISNLAKQCFKRA